MKTNYHSHTRWCRHGSGEIEEFIKEAIKNNIEVYGISEHIPFEGFKSFRLYTEELDKFMQEIDALSIKYKDEITILKALECEYFEELHDYYIELKEKYNLDYLVLAQHFKSIKFSPSNNDTSLIKDFFMNYSKEDVLDYEVALVKGINANLFDFIAHPDVFLNIYPFDETAKKVSNRIFELCQEKEMPLEINANGLRYNKGYPNWDFWKESKKYNLKYLINSDCHHPNEVYDQAVNDTYKKAKILNIEVDEYLF